MNQHQYGIPAPQEVALPYAIALARLARFRVRNAGLKVCACACVCVYAKLPGLAAFFRDQLSCFAWDVGHLACKLTVPGKLGQGGYPAPGPCS